ncbi:MAG: hypothetical protein JXJ30_10035 [Halothiobacillaceae bacterium]|nr:hypothetical protein [Halothiobacillaceae bacterium]
MQATKNSTDLPVDSEFTVLEPGLLDTLNPARHADRVVLQDGEEIGRMGVRRGRNTAWVGYRRFELRGAGDVTLGEFLSDFFGHLSGRRDRMRWHSAGGKRIDMGRDVESWRRPHGWLEVGDSRIEVAGRLERGFLHHDLHAQWLHDGHLIARLESWRDQPREGHIELLQPVSPETLILATHLTFWILPGSGSGGGGGGAGGGGGDGGGGC